jgi:hypothetical protein
MAPIELLFAFMTIAGIFRYGRVFSQRNTHDTTEEHMYGFIKVTKTTSEQGVREYWIKFDQIAMINTGQYPDTGPTGKREDEGVIWLKGTQVFVACDQTPEEIMILIDDAL